MPAENKEVFTAYLDMYRYAQNIVAISLLLDAFWRKKILK